MSEIVGIPAEWPAVPDDISVKQSDAARAVRMHLTGRSDRSQGETLAGAAAAIRAAFARGGRE